MLDPVSVKFVLGLVTLTLCLLFLGSYRKTRSAYNGWWCVALGLWLASNLALSWTGASAQWWAIPLGNALLVTGSFCVWGATRSLRRRVMHAWFAPAAGAAAAIGTAFDQTEIASAPVGLLYLLLMGTGMALAARELFLLKTVNTKAHVPLLLTALSLGCYFAVRAVVYVVSGPASDLFRMFLGPAVTASFLTVLLVIVAFSMTALSNDQLISSLREKATRDDLTGLLNRAAFTELAEVELKESQLRGISVTVIMADLDHFKSINDTHGHAAGDVAIKAFADACQAAVRRTDLVGRYGGEEFVIFLSGVLPDQATAISREISVRLKAMEEPGGVALPTVSYGISRSTGTDVALPDLIKDADTALYAAKDRGRDTIVSAPPQS